MTLQEVHPREWPGNMPFGLERVLRSRRFLVQVYQPTAGAVRLSVCRTDVSGGQWLDDITWEDLQAVKAQAGFSAREAVEVFPPDSDLVNVANMRHLWVLPEGERLPFSWKA